MSSFQQNPQSDLSSLVPRKHNGLPVVLSDELLVQVENVLESTDESARLVETEFMIQ